MDLEDVAVPVDDAGIETEPLVVLLVAAVPQLEQIVDPVPGVGLRVGPVQLDIPEGPLGHGVTILDEGSQLRLSASDRQGSDQSFDERHELCPRGGAGAAPARALGTTTRAR